ncbi:MAG: hypothetical protein CL843_09095 [Crocinitomicaceae bacterium]|nr:hypothetical protein [Crocinitomicaceae bacterium]|tara:strand:- start:2032 stop:3561 length:1530 start_codon:yes stop_codon:yes gene_type:complete
MKYLLLFILLLIHITGSTQDSIDSNYSKGLKYRSIGEVEQSVKSFISANDHFKNLNGRESSKINRSIGITLLGTDSILALKYFKKSLSIAITEDDTINIFKSSTCISSWYIDHETFDSAYKYLVIQKEFSNNDINTAGLLKLTESQILKDKKNYYKALDKIDSAKLLFQLSDNEKLYLQSEINSIALIYEMYGFSDDITYPIDSLNLIFDEGKYPSLAQTHYYNLYVIMKDLELYSEAIEYLKKSNSLAISNKSVNGANYANLKYLEEEVEKLEAIQIKNMLEIKNKNLVIITSIGIILLILLLASISWILISKQRRTEKSLIQANFEIQNLRKKRISTKLRKDIVDILFSIDLATSSGSQINFEELMLNAKNSATSLASELYPSTLISDFGLESSLEELSKVLFDDYHVTLNYHGTGTDKIIQKLKEYCYWIINETCMPIAENEQSKEIFINISCSNFINISIHAKDYFDKQLEISALEYESLYVIVKTLNGSFTFSNNLLKIKLPNE